MPICIAGDRDSGLELASRLLERLGVDLGPRGEPRFAQLNHELLRDGADRRALLRRAAELCEQLALREPWGWADLRNSQTLPFWRELFPDLRVLVCLQAEDDAAPDGASVVTRLVQLRAEPEAELRRLAAALGLDSSRTSISWAAASLDDASLAQEREGALSSDEGAIAEAQRRDLEHLRLELARARGHIESLRAQVEVRSLEPEDLRDVMTNLEEQLAERDEELQKLRNMILEGDAWRREMEAATRMKEEALERGIRSLQDELDWIRSTRLWRTGLRYWTFKARVRRLGKRGSV